MPAACHEKSSRNCHLRCCVICGVLGFCADGHAVGELLERFQAVGGDGVGEVGVLEDELVEPRAAEHPVVIHVDGVERIGADAPVLNHRLRPGAVRLRVGVSSVADRQVLRRRDVGRPLGSDQVFADRRGEDAVLAREQAQRVDGLLGIELGPFGGGEEVRAVLDDRAAERPPY